MKFTKLMLIVFILCTNNLLAQQKVHYTIDLSGKEKKEETVNLSSIAADIDYIPLETTKDSYITMVFRLIKTSENLLVLDYNNMKYTRLLIFDINGSFKKLIQNEGKGPGEYVSISDFTFDPVNKLIVILDSYQKKVLHFSLSGEFIREYALDIGAQDIRFIEPAHICMLVPLSRVKPETDGKLYNLFVFDLELNLMKRIPSTSVSTYPKDSPYLVVGGLNSYNEQLRLKLPFSDITYTFNRELELEKIIQFNMGRYKMPAAVYSSIEKRQRESKNYKEISGFIETGFTCLKYSISDK